MATPTKETTFNTVDDGTPTAWRETEFDSKHSVKLVNTAKDGLRLSEVKVYANDPMEAAIIAISTAREAMRMLQEGEEL